MKKKNWITLGIAAALVLVLILTFFLVKQNRARRLAEAIDAGQQAVIVSHDKTVFPDFVYNSDAISEDSIAGEKKQKSIPVSSAAIDEEAKLAGVIVRGSISSLSYTFIDGNAYTLADVTVTEVLKGNLVQGDIISVYYPGGYASVNDYNEFHGDKAEGSGYYRVSAGNVPEPVLEQDAVFFLTSPETGSAVPDGAFVPGFGKNSVLPFDGDGKSVKFGEERLVYDELKEFIVFPN